MDGTTLSGGMTMKGEKCMMSNIKMVMDEKNDSKVMDEMNDSRLWTR